MTVTGPRRAGTRRRFSLALPLVGMLLSWKTSVASGYDRSQREEEYFGSRLQQRELGHNLYQDPHQQQGGMMKYVGMAALGMVVEFLWTNRSLKKMKKQFDQEMTKSKEELANGIAQYIRKKQLDINYLKAAVEDADSTLMHLEAAAMDAGVDFGMQASQTMLDYDEFKQPDLNNDNIITRSEFNAYIKSYLDMYPTTKASDVPRFEDFDLNNDGMVNFSEWQAYLENHRRQNNEMMQGMYEFTAGTQGFDQLAQNMQRAQRRY